MAAITASLLAFPIPAQDLSTAPTSQLQRSAQQAIERQQFAAAVPALAELDRRYRASSETAIVQAREGVLYFLGLGQLQAGHFPAAAEALTEFIERYAQARSAPLARLYLGDAWFYQGRFGEARAAYDALAALPDALAGLDPVQQLGLWDRLSDCCVAASDWERGPAVFRALLASARRQLDPTEAREKSTKAGAYLLQAAIARDELDAASNALPALTGQTGAARYDLALNLSLVRGGDALYERGRHGEALAFYEQALPPARLQWYWETSVQRLETELARLPDGGWLSHRRNEIENRLATARQRLEHVRRLFAGEVPDYTSALHFRVARCYLARGRTFEAYWAFVRLEHSAAAHGGDAYLEEAVYGQVTTASACERPDRVGAAARRYLERGTWGRFLGDVADELVRVELQRDRAAALEVLRELAERVRTAPEAGANPRLVHLIGSTLLNLEELETLRVLFAALAQDASPQPFSDGVQYWLGLAAVFSGEFQRALEHFEWVRSSYSSGPYAEDAQFRIAVCRFGLLEYDEAERLLARFVVDHPSSRLISEARALLGDLAAAAGRIDDALSAYQAAEDAGALLDPPHLGYINHAVFQAGKLLAANQRWSDAARWFECYIERWGPQGRLTDALYELGRAQEALGRPEAVLESWFRAIVRFGHDPADSGVDLMLEAYPKNHRASTGEWPLRLLRDALERARVDRADALALRLEYALHGLESAEVDPPTVTEAHLPDASAAVLVKIARAEQNRNPSLAKTAAEAALTRYPSTPFVEDALHLIGGLEASAGNHEGALRAYRRAAEQFPASRRAASARLREGDLLRSAQRYDEAIAAYRTVLQTRQWRGAPWAEANYKIGLAHFQAGELKEAFGFCQRVYVLYGTIAEWAAPAYLQSGLALEALGRADDAAATYRELLAREDLKDLPASREAERRLAALR